jgi:hypothetical protein
MKQFTEHEVQGFSQRSDLRSFDAPSAIKKFIRTGIFQNKLNVDPDQFDDESEFQEALKRESKLQQTNYVVPPDKIMQSLHLKTHFKGC